MNKKVLILIPIYNGVQGEFLDGCFSSLVKINYPKEDYQILAVDDVSSDSSVDFIQSNFPEIKIISNKENLGFAGSNNIGFKFGIENKFDYVFMLNQDTEVDPDFLYKAVELAESDKKIGAVQSKLMLFNDKMKINSIGNELHYLGFGYTGGYKSEDRVMTPKEITYPSGAAVLLRTSVLREVGLLNEEFYMYHEDLDLGWRIWLNNYKIMLAPESIVYHKYDFSRSIQKYYFMERNRYLVMMQNYKMATILVILPAAMAMDIAMFIYSCVGCSFRCQKNACVPHFLLLVACLICYRLAG